MRSCSPSSCSICIEKKDEDKGVSHKSRERTVGMIVDESITNAFSQEKTKHTWCLILKSSLPAVLPNNVSISSSDTFAVSGTQYVAQMYAAKHAEAKIKNVILQAV